MTMNIDIRLAPPFVGLVTGFGVKTLGDISIANLGDATPSALWLVLFNGLKAFAGGSPNKGQELVDEKWVEVSQDGGVTWVPIGGRASSAGNRLEVASVPAPGETTTVKARLNIPVEATTAGDIVFDVEGFTPILS